MFEVAFLLCLTNGVDFNITLERERGPSCYAISVEKISCQMKGYEQFKVHENSNLYNSEPEVDIDTIPTPVFIIHRVL